jgi:NTP pyrophosphatase (non-canonical NTP hydrolase)
MNEYQEAAKATALPTALKATYLIPGLAAEAGEVCGLYAKWIRDGGDMDYLRVKLIKELGDVLWFVALIAHDLECDLDKVARLNVEKLHSRQLRGVIGGSGDER